MSQTKTVGVVTVVFPAYAGDYGSAGEHTCECVVPDYLAGLSAADLITVLVRHCKRTARTGEEITVTGGRLLRALGECGAGLYPSGRDITPAARDAALADAIRSLHAAVPERYISGDHTHYVRHLLDTPY